MDKVAKKYIETNTLILGAGLAGLSAALHIKNKCVIVEKEPYPGGVATSIKTNGFIFDKTGHLLHIHTLEGKKIISEFVKLNKALKRNSFIYFENKLIPYPFQANIHSISLKKRINCIKDFITERFNRKNSETFYSWAKKTFGKSICRYFMYPYNKKLWKYPLKKLTTEWCKPYVPEPDVKSFLENAVFGKRRNWGYNKEFYYPENGIWELPDNIYKKISSLHSVYFCEEVLKISLKEKIAETTTLIIKYKNLISTIPLKKLCYISDDSELKELAKGLVSRDVLCLNIGAKSNVKNISWIYFPEKFPFYRIGIQSSFSKQVVPDKDHSSFYIEFSLKNTEKLDLINLYESAITALKKLKFIKKRNDVVAVLWVRIPNGYVVFDSYRKNVIKKIISKLERYSCFTAGRYGKWEYTFMEQAILDGKNAAEKIIES